MPKKKMRYFLPDFIDMQRQSFLNFLEKGIVEEFAKRKASWIQPPLKVDRGVLLKYARSVSSASTGCVTDN